ncbi:progressive ankylosis protein homolog isoform X1 [Branchiostoma floridae x Branchiostoma belcheri]
MGDSMGDYWRLVRFMVPLAFITIAPDIADQALSRSIAFSENVTASYGLAFSLTKFMGGGLQQTRHIGLILVHQAADGRRAVGLTVVMGLVVAVIHILIGLTPLGLLLIEKAHQVDSVVGAGSRRAMLFLGGFPLLDGLSFVFIGMLLQYHHSLIVAVSFIADCCAQVVLSLTLMESALQSWDPILIPILAQYAALLVRLSIILAGFLYKVRPKIKQAQPLAEKESFTIVRALKFWWPLALVTVCNKLSRPIINLLVARDLGGSAAVEAVAVLTVVYPIGHMPYSCLNEMKSVVPAFRKRGQGRRVIPWLTLSKFALACLLLVLTVALVVFYVPGITFAIMTGWIETSANIARLCQKPLQIFAFVAVPVGVRAFLSSWLMVQKRTWILTPSAIVRTVALVTALVVLPKLHIRGADMGIAALLTGFLAEVAVVALGFLIIRRRLRNQTPTPDNTETGGPTSPGSQTDEAGRPMLTEHETTL